MKPVIAPDKVVAPSQAAPLAPIQSQTATPKKDDETVVVTPLVPASSATVRKL